MTYQVHFIAQRGDKATVSDFEVPQAALTHAQNLTDRPYFRIDLHDTLTGERFTCPQFAHRHNLDGDIALGEPK